MSSIIPNTGKVGSDLCISPIEVEVPFVIVDNGNDCFWFPQVMDTLSAERMAFAIRQGVSAEAYQVDVKVILPAACVIRATTSELNRLKSKPVRAKLRAE